MEEKEETLSPEAMKAADRILAAIHGCWKDSTFNLRKSKLLAEYPECEDDNTLQFFLEELEKTAKERQSLQKMFCFAMKCKIRTYASTNYNEKEILLYWDNKMGDRAAELAFAGLTAWLSKKEAVIPLNPPETLTQNTKSVYSGCGNHPGADAALHTLINAIPYLQDKVQWEKGCLDGLGLALCGNHIPDTPFHWFLPVRTEEAKNFGKASNSPLGTSAVFTFGVIME